MMRHCLFFYLGIMLLLSSTVWADIPKQINFQGVLKDTLGVPLPDGNYTLTFRIYDDPSAGNVLWQEADVFTVTGGLVTHILGSFIPIPESIFNDSLRWLGVQVGAQEILPRRQLVSVAYSYVADFAQNADKLGGVEQSNFVRRTGPDSVVSDTGVAFSTRVTANQTSQAIGISTAARNNSSGQSIGGSFFAGSEGTGFHWGATAGAMGASTSATTGIAAWAENTSSGEVSGGIFDAYSSGTGTHYGIQASGTGASSSETYGVHGSADNTSSGATYGGFFTTGSSGTGAHYGLAAFGNGSSSTFTIGCYGSVDNSSSGEAYGGYFASSSSGTGIHYGLRSEGAGSSVSATYGSYSRAVNTSGGTTYGGYFLAPSNGTGTHYAIYGQAASASSAHSFGSYGIATSTSTGNAYGGYLEATASGTAGNAIGARAAGTGFSFYDTYGCYGIATNTSSGWAVGGYFTSATNGTGIHYGIYGDGNGSTSAAVYGARCIAENTSTGTAYGGRFEAISSGTGTHYGVYGSEAAGGSGAAVYAAGDMIASGAKPAVVKSSQGHRLLYAMESPEVWFEDFGEGQLVKGHAHIKLDALFLETVTINASNPMKVFVQLTSGNPVNAVVSKGTTGFDVAVSDNSSAATFDYRIVAKRKGYETQRLMQTDVGMDDPNLYPELWDNIEKEHQERQAEMEKSRIQQ